MNLQHANVYTSEGPSKEQEFKLWGTFYEVVPVDEDTPEDEAQSLNCKVSGAIQSRLRVFGRLLNLTIRQNTVGPWKEIDVCLTSLATLLEEGGLHGALEAIRPEVERVKSLVGGNGSGD